MAHEDDIQTQLMTRNSWLPPVSHVDELPIDGVAEETRCFVDPDDAEVEEVWVFRHGKWHLIDTL